MINKNNIPLLYQYDTIVVNEKIAFLKFANCYQLYNQEGQIIGYVQQELSTLAKIARFFVNKKILPFKLHILDQNKNRICSISKSFSLFLNTVKIHDLNNQEIGSFKQKFKLMGAKFEIYNASSQQIGLITGDWKGWDFTINDANGNQIGIVNKKWHGTLKEVFTTADKYIVRIDPQVQENTNKALILSVAIAMDMILKEG